MWIFQNFQLLFFVSYGFALQNQYTVLQENIILYDIHHNFIEMSADVFKINETTNGLNLTFVLKINLPKDSKFAANAFKKINGEYRLGLVNIYKTIQSGLQMEMFDLQGLFIDHCRPPMVWPLEEGIMHNCVGWSPDSTKFPPHLPAGQWKVPISIMFANNTKIIVVNWYLKLTYKK